MAHILVIDDEALIRSLLKEMLEKAGHDVTEAPNGKIGIQSFHEHPADLVITDMIMPQQEGLSTIFDLKKEYPDLKIIAISGEGGGDETDNYLEAAEKFGATRTFNKPVKGEVLIKAIEEILIPEAFVSEKVSPFQSSDDQILIVDEQPKNSTISTAALRSAGHTLIEAPSYDEALLLAQKHSFALVLLVTSGQPVRDLKLVQNILRIEKACPPFLVFLTEQTNPAFIVEIYKAGAIDILLKPIPEETLASKVRIFLDLYQQKLLMARQTRSLENALHTQCTISDNLIQTAKELKQSKQQLEIVYSELERMTGVFQLFVPKPFLNRIATENTFQAGHFEAEKLSILFGDIRGYTHHSEQLTPSENFEFLNDFFSLMEPPITQNEGFIDKFIGDGIMALFDQEASADHALQAAIEMQDALQTLSRQRLNQGLSEIKMGIGINTGEAMVGALGSANRLNSTVIGDHVNLSARLEELTKKCGVQILISEYTYSLLQEKHYHIREIDTVKVRGKSTPVVIYEVFDNDPLETREVKLKTKEIFSRGIELYKTQQFAEALKIFQQCLEIHQDGLFFEYVKRCDYFQKHPPQDHSWDSTIAETDLLIEHARRRRVPRYEVNTPAEVYTSSTDFDHLSGIAMDISINGMKLDVAQRFEIGAILFVEMVFPSETRQHDSPSKFKLLAQVKWIRSSSPATLSSWQIGLETIEVPSTPEISFQQALGEYCQETSPLQ